MLQLYYIHHPVFSFVPNIIMSSAASPIESSTMVSDNTWVVVKDLVVENGVQGETLRVKIVVWDIELAVDKQIINQKRVERALASLYGL